MGNKRERENVYRKSGHHRRLMAKGVSVRAVNNYKFNFCDSFRENVHSKSRNGEVYECMNELKSTLNSNKIWGKTQRERVTIKRVVITGDLYTV